MSLTLSATLPYRGQGLFFGRFRLPVTHHPLVDVPSFRWRPNRALSTRLTTRPRGIDH
jgi:hypothetical protein